MARDPMRTFRASDELWQAVRRAAEAAGVSTSEWIRAALLAALKKRG